jgi:hypothetical protein
MIADFQLPIADLASGKVECGAWRFSLLELIENVLRVSIDNRQLAIGND